MKLYGVLLLLFHTFIENDFVAKDFDVEFPVCKKTVQDVSTGLASGLYI